MALESVARTEPVSRYGQRQEIPSKRGKVHYSYLFKRGMYDFGYDTGAYYHIICGTTMLGAIWAGQTSGGT